MSTYVCRLCDTLAADFYVPFASQAVFERPDSCWANDYRTSYDDLRRYWRSKLGYCRPTPMLDLGGFRAPFDTRRAVPADGAVASWLHLPNTASLRRKQAALSAEDVAGLERKLNAFRWVLWLFFPRGFGFQLGERRLATTRSRGRLREGNSPNRGDFIVVVPKLTMKEAIANNHVSELGISMFLRIRLLRRLDPRKVYALFALLQVDDYGHFRNAGALLRWLGRGLRHTFALRLPAPSLPKSSESVRRGQP